MITPLMYWQIKKPCNECVILKTYNYSKRINDMKKEMENKGIKFDNTFFKSIEALVKLGKENNE